MSYEDKGEGGEVGGEHLGEDPPYYARGEDETRGETTEAEGESEEGYGGRAYPVRRRKRFRRQRFCKPKRREEEVESAVSSVFGADDESEESMLLRYPDLEIPTELLNSHPRPAKVTESDPLVAKLLEERLDEAEKWTDSVPPEIYSDILVRAIAEVELKYLEANNRGPL